jgi:predicted nuclease with RNAse H fold
MTTWFGADPGGVRNFGVAALHADGSFETWCRSSVDEAVALMEGADGVGIDCPMWWTSAQGGGRRVDAWLRHKYGIHPLTVQAVNALRGAVVVQGIMLAMRLRERSPDLPITEAHPKPLLIASGHAERGFGLTDASWPVFAEKFKVAKKMPRPRDEHQRDALLGAVAAREGASGAWRDLSVDRDPSELDPKHLWFGKVNYWWPQP